VYSYQWVSKSQFITIDSSFSGFSIPGSVNLRYSVTNEPGKYWVTWQEYQKTFSYHQHSTYIEGHANIVAILPSNGESQSTALTLGQQVLDGQALPNHVTVGLRMVDELLSAVQVDGSESNDNIEFGSGFAQIIDGKGGDDYISIEILNEGIMAKGFLNGGDGNDTILGGYYDDILIGGNGADYLKGGVGADRYILSGDGIDLVDPVQASNWRSGIDTDTIELPEGVTFGMLTTQYGTAYLRDEYYRSLVVPTVNLNWSGKTHAMVVLPFKDPYFNYGTDSYDSVVLRFADGKTVTMETLLANTQTADSHPFIWG
jgi:hypothetical protein